MTPVSRRGQVPPIDMDAAHTRWLAYQGAWYQMQQTPSVTNASTALRHFAAFVAVHTPYAAVDLLLKCQVTFRRHWPDIDVGPAWRALVEARLIDAEDPRVGR